MTTFTRTWDATYESLPEDDDDALEGAARIRHIRTDTRERMVVDHSWAGDAHDGKHKQVTLRVQAGDPTLDADDIGLYTKADAYGKSKLWLKDEGGNVIPFHGGFSTGDCKITIKTAADPGWVLFNDGTIGNAASGATTRANADTEALFSLIWTNTADAQCAVSGGRGASAAADYAANKTIALPKALGRALAVYGTGAGLTARVLALAMGAQDGVVIAHTHTGTTGGISANHTHSTHDHLNNSKGNDSTDSGGTVVGGNTGTVSADHTHAFTTNSTGVAATDTNLQPTIFLNLMVKL